GPSGASRHASKRGTSSLASLGATADAPPTMYRRGLTGRIMQHPPRLVILMNRAGDRPMVRTTTVGRWDVAARLAGQMLQPSGRLPLTSSLRIRSGAEVRDRRGTADALNPDILDPGNVGGNVLGGDDHLRGE